jgi:phosphatidylserine decarboxylase
MEKIVQSMILALVILIPVAYKWELDIKNVFMGSIFIGFFVGLVIKFTSKFLDLNVLSEFITSIILIILTSLSLLLIRFYRDPERIPPEDRNSILSPADGKVIYVKNIEEGKVPFSEKNRKKFPLNDFVQSDVLSGGGYLIGISMTYLDVHINRAPIGGTVRLLKHIKGLFISLKKKEAVLQNERVLTVIDNSQFKVGIVQIASRLVRKIVPYLSQGQEVQKGERIGIIRFGSQVDLILPNLQSLQIMVKPGAKVKAGRTIVAMFNESI